MISQLSLITLIIVAIIIVGLFFILMSFSLPKSFYKNQAKREKMLKDKIKWAAIAENAGSNDDADTGNSTEDANDDNSSVNV